MIDDKGPSVLYGAVARAAAAQHGFDKFWQVREVVETEDYVLAVYEDGMEITASKGSS